MIARILPTFVLATLCLTACGSKQENAPAPASIVIYPAGSVITMDEAAPRAQAVAVMGRKIVALGSEQDIRKQFEGEQLRVDRRFAGKVIMPGFIEPHLHPYIAGILLPMEFITPHDWDLPGRRVKAVRGREAYLARLAEVEANTGKEDWLWTWGYHHYFHGQLSRADLDRISATRPIVVWHRSFHEIYLNSAAVAALNITEELVAGKPQLDLERGHFYENGLMVLLPALMPILMEPARYLGALEQARQIIHRGGITTVGDGAFGSLGLDMELAFLQKAGWESDDTPFRMSLLMDGKALGARLGFAGARELIEDTAKNRSGHRLRIPARQVKLFADGAAYSQLMMMSEPYLDGHRGEWLMEPEQLEEAASLFWNAGFQIHVHVNGDEGLDRTLDILEKLQQETPRSDHRFTIHHMAYARPGQAARVAKLGAMVQANPYYLWALADKYSEVGLGPERAAGMVPLKSFADAGVPLAFHSDFTMAPAQPLLLAWVAANRIAASGRVYAPQERVDLKLALRAITIEAARQIGLERETGSLEVGKSADFTILEQDPFAIPLAQLKDIAIWGTVFEGRVYPL